MISTELEFQAPEKLPEVLSLLRQYGSDAKLLAGGMSLIPMMTLGLLHPERIISLNHVADLDYVRDDGRVLRIGALTRHATIRSHALIRQHAPLLAEAAGFIGDPQVRNRGTLGGSLAHADPAADYLPVVIALGAQFKLQKASGERSVDAKDFFRDLMTTALTDDELLTEVTVPKLAPGSGSSYQRLHRVEGNFAIVAAAAIVEPGFRGARIALGGVGPKPVLFDVGARLGKGATEAALAGIGDDAYAASGDAYGDLNGDAAYRRAMARVYARRVATTAAAQVKK